MGRPSTSARFTDVETIAKVVIAHGAKLETQNPSAIIFEENNPGIIKEEFRNERALSVIIEAMIEPEELPGLLKDLKEAQKNVETVFSVDVITRMSDGEIPTDKLLEEAGVNAALTARLV